MLPSFVALYIDISLSVCLSFSISGTSVVGPWLSMCSKGTSRTSSEHFRQNWGVLYPNGKAQILLCCPGDVTNKDTREDVNLWCSCRHDALSVIVDTSLPAKVDLTSSGSLNLHRSIQSHRSGSPASHLCGLIDNGLHHQT
jgi:hypothetical protein